MLKTTITYNASWKDAPPPKLICNADGTHHFSEVKKLALSGKHYIHAVNNPIEPTSKMLIGTAVHFMVLGARPGSKPLAIFAGKSRNSKAYEAFCEEKEGHEVLLAGEWNRAEDIANAVMADPIAKARLTGARFEVPLEWDEGDIRCSTSGVDIVTSDDAIGDLKVTFTTYPEQWMRHAMRMLYPQQVAWYRRGARANGIRCAGGLFLLGVENKAPFDVVDLDLTEDMIDRADRTIDLWLEKLRLYRASGEWPGYAQSRVPFGVPSYMADEDEDEELDDLDAEHDSEAA